MANVNPKALIEKLNQVCHRKLMEAAALCSSRTHYEVQLEHWLIKLLEIPDSDLTSLFRHYEIDAARVRRELEASLNRMKTGSGGRSEEHTSELQSHSDLVCRLLLEKKNKIKLIKQQHTTVRH